MPLTVVFSDGVECEHQSAVVAIEDSQIPIQTAGYDSAVDDNRRCGEAVKELTSGRLLFTAFAIWVTMNTLRGQRTRRSSRVQGLKASISG